jgi:hypothetical protein
VEATASGKALRSLRQFHVQWRLLLATHSATLSQETPISAASTSQRRYLRRVKDERYRVSAMSKTVSSPEADVRPENLPSSIRREGEQTKVEEGTVSRCCSISFVTSLLHPWRSEHVGHRLHVALPHLSCISQLSSEK